MSQSKKYKKITEIICMLSYERKISSYIYVWEISNFYVFTTKYKR